MRSVRLLPIVIFAALALLLFKGVGLVTNGGYVLSGPVATVAGEGGGEPDMPVSPTPSEAVMTDSSPTLGDGAPTLPAKAEVAPGGEHDASSSAVPSGHTDGSSSVASSASADQAAAAVCPDTAPTLPAVAAASSASAPPGQHDLADKMGNAMVKDCPSVEVPVNAHGDVLPSTKDGNGKIVPLAAAEGDESQSALIDRLGARRAPLQACLGRLGSRSQISTLESDYRAKKHGVALFGVQPPEGLNLLFGFFQVSLQQQGLDQRLSCGLASLFQRDRLPQSGHRLRQIAFSETRLRVVEEFR